MIDLPVPTQVNWTALGKDQRSVAPVVRGIEFITTSVRGYGPAVYSPLIRQSISLLNLELLRGKFSSSQN
jgi:hypothetical protein